MRVADKLKTSALALAILATACTGSSNNTDSPTSTTEPGIDAQADGGLPAELNVADVVELPCSGSANEAPNDFQQVLDVVALPTAPTYPNALQTSIRDAEDGTVYFFAKTGLWWRGHTTFQLSVPAELHDVMAIGWGGPAELAHTVSVDCDPDTEDGWLVLAGGYWVREPMCAELIVEAGGNSQTLKIGLGLPCPGQDPPAGPSDS